MPTTMTATVVTAALTYFPYCAHHALRSSSCSCSSRSKTAMFGPCKEKRLSRGYESCRDFVRRQRRLLAGFTQRLDRDPVGRGLVVADNEREARAARVRALHLRLERPAAGVEHDRE